jgi:hypothetical protein
MSGMTVVANGCPITNVGHDSHIDSRHHGNEMEQGGPLTGKYQRALSFRKKTIMIRLQ